MKKNSNLLLVSVFILFFLGSCISKENHIVKMTIVPQGALSISTPNDLNTAAGIIKKRLNTFGIPSEKLNLEVSADKMILKIDGIDTGKLEILKGIVTTPGDLGFWETYENEEIIPFLLEANNKLRGMNLPDQIPAAEIPVADTVKNEEQMLLEEVDSTTIAERAKFNKENPLFAILFPRVYNDGKPLPSCLIGLADIKDTAKVARLLNYDEIRALFPRDVVFIWSQDPYKYDESGKLYELHAIKAYSSEDVPPLDGSVITQAKPVSNKSGTDFRLNFSMNSYGTRTWASITRKNINRCIAVVIDGHVRSYPRVQNEITGGQTEISGDFTQTEAQFLASILSSGGGVLPIKLRISDLQTEVKK
jgi:SecD/SecF fusion protein